jgi:hypothetical protein
MVLGDENFYLYFGLRRGEMLTNKCYREMLRKVGQYISILSVSCRVYHLPTTPPE